MHRSNGLNGLLEHPTLYDALQRALGGTRARTRLVRDFLRSPPNARILDIGCGTAALLDHLPRDVQYVGCDVNPRYIHAARARHGGRGTFLHASLDALPAPRAHFDLVLTIAVLHHLDDQDAGSLLAAARTRLAPRGILVTVDAARHSGQGALSRLLVALDRGRAVKTPEQYQRLARVHFASVESTLVTDLLPVPYGHFIMRASAPP